MTKGKIVHESIRVDGCLDSLFWELSYTPPSETAFSPVKFFVPKIYNDRDLVRAKSEASDTLIQACGKASCIGDVKLQTRTPYPPDFGIVITEACIDCISSHCPLPGIIGDLCPESQLAAPQAVDLTDKSIPILVS